MLIRGIEGVSMNELADELDRGGKFVHFTYCVSIVIMTFRRSSSIYFIRAGEGRAGKVAITLPPGWWGIPWGPIYTVSALQSERRTRRYGGGSRFSYHGAGARTLRGSSLAKGR
jgi:hypothetical protein